MVHARYNQKEVNPNSAINFIASLPDEPTRQEEARQFLRALAAQVKPVMKQHGFEVNSLEEYEYNAVFAGRNWNNGETIELVLRKPDGSFYPTSWLMSTLCHELAHIKHMNHGPAFQALWSRLRTEVCQLQARGYYGDGFWSSGTRLRDLVRIGGNSIKSHDLPEYVCGGAQTRSRPTARRRRVRRGPRREIVPSLHTGAQTAKKRKPGGRVTSKYAFTGEGLVLNQSDDGTMGFGKRANSKRARDERALAAERRILSLQAKPQEHSTSAEAEEESTTDEEVEIISETDTDRRQALLDSERSSSDLQRLTMKDWDVIRHEFKSETSTSGSKYKVESSSKPSWSSAPVEDDFIEILSSDDDKGSRCDVLQSSGSTFTTGNVQLPISLSRSSKGKEREQTEPVSLTLSTSRTQKARGRLIQFEFDCENTEGGNGTIFSNKTGMSTAKKSVAKCPNDGSTQLTTEKSATLPMWNCLVCTLENNRHHLACSACGTPKGQLTWSDNLAS